MDEYHEKLISNKGDKKLQVERDEFDSNGVEAINATKWHHQTQIPVGGSWYNGELQHYTNREINSFVSNGNLSIVAKRETYNNQGQTKQFTSARLNSKFAFKYGRIEVRTKLATGILNIQGQILHF